MTLDPEQEELLRTLVEAVRAVPRSKRREFVAIDTFGSTQTRVMHPGLPSGLLIYFGDVEELASQGLVRLDHRSSSETCFDVTSPGTEYYEEMIRRGEPVERVEAQLRAYVTSDRFKSCYPEAFANWLQAEELLWSSDSAARFTQIGHTCREAMQKFIDALVATMKPQGVERDRSKNVSRLRSVLAAASGRLGSTEQAFLEALVAYWGTVSDLVQRQEHGANREGESLVLEDARRVVFQTLVVFYEIDRAVSRQ